MDDIRAKFQGDLEKIATDFIRLYGLQFEQEVENLSDPLLRWIDFRLRYIDPVPRTIFLSNKFPKNLSSPVANGLGLLSRLIQEGKDINGFQSKSIIRFNDLSGKRKAKRTDLLWADWGITHLHITDNPIPADSFFSDRKCSNGESWLLFCLFVGDSVGFVDVRMHEDDLVFSDHDLIVTMKESWPWYMDNFRLKGIHPPEKHVTNVEIASLRRNGLTTFASIEGEVFLGPGLGLTTAATPLRVTQTAGRVRHWVDSLATFAMNPDGQLQKEMVTRGIVKTEFSLCVTPRGISIYEENSDLALVFGKASDEYAKKMVSLICPDWALNRLVANNQMQPTVDVSTDL